MIFDFEERWNINLGYLGLFPQRLDGAYGILFSPLLHGDLWHLLSNTFPLLLLGTTLYYFYEKIANKVVVGIYFISGILLWIGYSPFPYNDFMVRQSYHIGASGLVYGMASFLIFSGFFRKNKESSAIALAVIFLYGGLLYGIFPKEDGTSYEAHFFGALVGVLLAFYFKNTPIFNKKNSSDNTPDYRQTKSNFTYTPSHFTQNTSTILMIKPLNFGFNEETANSNHFQYASFLVSDNDIKKKAIEEFDAFTLKLKNEGINTLIFEDQHNKKLPDAIFPNNWISFHQDGKVILYPMLSKKRREERREDIIDILSHKFRFHITEKIDFSPFENKDMYLEGTGSIVFDHINKIAYASISTRTNKDLFLEYCKKINYTPLVFHAFSTNGNSIYHTNVLLSVGENFAVICSDVIKNDEERVLVLSKLRSTKQYVIEITEEQMNHFCANILQLENIHKEKVIAMSSEAFNTFSEEQKSILLKNGKIIYSNLTTIENYGGGSARCMMAEIFLPL